MHASADKTPGASTIVTSLPDAKKVGDPWKDEDRNQLIGLGDISVRREWDVQHGKTGLGAVTDPYKIDGSKEFRPGRFGGDDVV